MATTTGISCEVLLTEGGDLARVSTDTKLKVTFGVPGHEEKDKISGVFLYSDSSKFSGKQKYALLTAEGKTVVTIGDAVEDVKKGVMVTADGATGQAAHNGEGDWFYLGA